MASGARIVEHWRTVVLGGSAIGLLASCGFSDAFACSEQGQCVQGGVAGTCEPSGYCSFPDPDCPSESRYGSLAPSGLAGECVEPSATNGAGTDPTAAGDSSDSTPDPGSTTNPGGGSTSSTGADSEETQGTTGAPAACGDGKVDPGEMCDDGNSEDGDGCNTDCVESGAVLWLESIVGDGDGHDRAYALSVSALDEIVVCGRIFNATSDGFVRQYVDDALAWTYEIDLHGGVDVCEGIDTDADGWIVAVGGSGGMVMEPYVIVLDSAGTLVTTGYPEVPDPTVDSRVKGVAVSPDGFVAIGGANGTDAFLASYDQQGQELWMDVMPATDQSMPHDIELLGGDFVAAGWLASADTGSDFWVASYDATGGKLWQDIVDSGVGGTSDDRFHALAVMNRTVTAVGRTGGTPNAMVAAVYAADGAQVEWRETPSEVVTSARDLVFMPNGDVTVVGWEQAVDSDTEDGWVRRYTPEGELRWERFIEPRAGAVEVVTSIGLLSTGDLVVAGYVENSNLDGFVSRLAP